MEKLNKKEFAKIFSAVCEMYDKDPSEMFIELYYNALADLTIEQFQKAANHILQTRKYTKMPLPAEIRNFVFGDPEQRAIKAVDQIEAAIVKYGSYHSICFTDNVINHIVANYGWERLGQITYDEWHFVRKDFIKSYMTYDQSRDRLTKIENLVGYFERINSQNGHFHYSQDTKMIDETIIGLLPEGSKLIDKWTTR